MIDLVKTAALLAELAFIDEKIADRGPIKFLPRPSAEIPDVPKLKARQQECFKALHVRRNYKVAKGHDLDGGGNAANPQTKVPYFDLTTVGVVSAIKKVAAGADRSLPAAQTIVQVNYPSGDHLWHAPEDLEHAP